MVIKSKEIKGTNKGSWLCNTRKTKDDVVIMSKSSDGTLYAVGSKTEVDKAIKSGKQKKKDRAFWNEVDKIQKRKR